MGSEMCIRDRVRAVTGAAENTSAAPSKPPSALRAALSSALVNEVKNVATLGKRVPVLAVKVVGALWDAPAPQLGDEVYVSVHGQLRDGRVVQSASTRPSPRSSSTIWNEELLLPLPADASQLSAVLLELRGSAGEELSLDWVSSDPEILRTNPAPRPYRVRSLAVAFAMEGVDPRVAAGADGGGAAAEAATAAE